MNVEYRCEECGSRIFALPGGTKLKCRMHAEAKMLQVEGYNGTDFIYVDENGRTQSKDLVGPENTRVARNTQADAGSNVNKTAVLDPDVELEMSRKFYETVMGEKPDGRWGASRIMDELRDNVSVEDVASAVATITEEGSEETDEMDDEGEDDPDE